MIRAVILLAALSAAANTFGQEGNVLRLHIQNKETQENVGEARITVKDTDIAGTSDANGKAALTNIPNGEQTVEILAPGFETVELRLTFPLSDLSERVLPLTVNFDAGQVTVTTTRTGREIEAEPTRVEVIDEEEVDEKINMRPANVSMALHESTGIQVQQTSATTSTQSVRIQGVDGRYTQILKDGFPAFGGFSGSLSILEILPLDLKQVEIIKGPSATLFGQGAITGVINFVPKLPDEKLVTTLIFNQTSALGTDASLFNSKRYERFGYTLLGSANYQREYDADNDDFTDLPRTRSFAINPRLFFYVGPKTTLAIGNSLSYQKRTGGDVIVIRGNPNGIHQYVENNDSFRNITTVSFEKAFDDGGRVNARQSLAYFARDLNVPDYRFKGEQFNSYTDIAYFRSFGKHALVFGGSAIYDRFREKIVPPNTLDRSETRATVGGFIQDTVDLTNRLSLESGFRLDYAKYYGTFALPRVSLLYKFTERLTTRVGYGLGYKTPSVFTEDAEELLFRNIVGIGNTLEAERSQGGTLDINYNGQISEKIGFSVNQLFFYTQISDPLVLELDASKLYRYHNSDSPLISKGFETNAKFTRGIGKLFIGYTFTDAKAGYLGGDQRVTLLPRHKVNSSLVFEKAESFKAGAEFYYGSRQVLDDRTLTRSIAEFGLFGEKTFGKYSIFVNGENLFDERQGRYGPVVLGPHNNPTFAEVYTHLEGRVFNGGVKIRL